ncbi:ribonuclease H-like protein, partial [Eremomyces bilateralis CBS 781.70]
SYWRHKLYKGPQGQPVLVHYCRSRETTEREATLFATKPVLGFDIEWQLWAGPSSGIKANVALIQLACEDHIGLFHIALHRGETAEELIGPVLKGILENPAIIKTGVNIRGDSTRLAKSLNVEMQGLFELSHIYRLVTFGVDSRQLVNKRLVSLSHQVEDIMGLPLHKGDVRTSNWKEPLSSEQATYAASDAYAGFQLFYALEARRMKMDPRPPRPHLAELNLPIQLPEGLEPANIPLPESDEEVEESEDGDSDARCESKVRGCADREVAPFPPEPFDNAKPSGPNGRVRQDVHVGAELKSADDWISNYSNALPNGQTLKSSRSALRAYVLWHVSGMEPAKVASVLRQPPLKVATVCTYILESTKAENLEYDKGRLENVLREGIPENLWWRYKQLLGD